MLLILSVHQLQILFSTCIRQPQSSPLFPYTTLFRSSASWSRPASSRPPSGASSVPSRPAATRSPRPSTTAGTSRSEEHTSELQSPCNLVCRLLLEKKKETSAL